MFFKHEKIIVSGAKRCGKIRGCLRVASVVKTKSVLIGHSLNRLNKMNEVKSFEFYLCILLYMYFFLFIVILFINCETCFYEFNVFSLIFGPTKPY